MKIALVSPYTLPQCRGNSILAERLFTGLSARGHSVRLFNAEADAPAAAARFLPDIVHSLHAQRPNRWLLSSGLIPQSRWVATLTGTDYNPEQSGCGLTDSTVQLLARARALVAFHAEAAASISARHPALAPLLRIIPQGVEASARAAGRPELRRTFGIAPQEIVFFMAAGLRAVKNIRIAIAAFTDIKHSCPAARLLLAGPAIEASEARAVLDAGARQNGFDYLGKLTPARTRELMACADVFLNTSLSEGMPGAVMEALSEGLPVIATDIPGNRALIHDGHNGLLVPTRDAPALARAGCRLAADAGLRLRMGEHGKQQAASHYGCCAELDLHEQLYYEIIGIGRSLPAQTSDKPGRLLEK